jgi:hypothetical protein
MEPFDATSVVSEPFTATKLVVVTFELVRFVMEPFVPAMFVEVTLLNVASPPFNTELFSVWIVPDVAFKFVNVPFVPVTLVDETLVATRFVVVTFELVRFLIKPFEELKFVDVAFVNTAFVAFKSVKMPVVATRCVVVASVKTAVDGFVAPIEVPLTVPPVIVTFGETRPAALIDNAFNVVPDAVAKPNHPVDVPFVKERVGATRLWMVPEDEVRLVIEPFVPATFVEVTLLNVAFPPFNVALFNVLIVPDVELKFVIEPFVALSEAVVSTPSKFKLLPVAFTKRTF